MVLEVTNYVFKRLTPKRLFTTATIQTHSSLKVHAAQSLHKQGNRNSTGKINSAHNERKRKDSKNS